MEKEELKVNIEKLKEVLGYYYSDTELALWAYDCADDKEEIELKAIDNNGKEQLLEYFDDETKREIVGDSLGWSYSASKIIENTNINDLLEIITEKTGLTLEDIISKGSVDNETRRFKNGKKDNI